MKKKKHPRGYQRVYTDAQLTRMKRHFIKHHQEMLTFEQDRIANILGLVRVGSGKLSR